VVRSGEERIGDLGRSREEGRGGGSRRLRKTELQNTVASW